MTGLDFVIWLPSVRTLFLEWMTEAMETTWDLIVFSKFLSIPEVPERKGLAISVALGVEKFHLEN